MSEQFNTGKNIWNYWADIATGIPLDTARYLGYPVTSQGANNPKQAWYFRYAADTTAGYGAANFQALNAGANENVGGVGISPYVRIPGGFCG